MTNQSNVTNDNLIPTRKRIRIQEWSEEQSEKIQLLKKTFMEKSTQTTETRMEQPDIAELAKVEIYKSLLSNVEHDLECGICKEVYLDCCILPCGHIFCSFCIRMWFLNADSCPICRLVTEFIIGTKIIDNFLTKLLAIVNKDLIENRQDMISDRKTVLQQAEANWVAQNNNHYYPPPDMWQEWLSLQSNSTGNDDTENNNESSIRSFRLSDQIFNDSNVSNQRISRNLWPWTSSDTLAEVNNYQNSEILANMENDNLIVDLDYDEESNSLNNL